MGRRKRVKKRTEERRVDEMVKGKRWRKEGRDGRRGMRGEGSQGSEQKEERERGVTEERG